jgi:hypothetical protein
MYRVFASVHARPPPSNIQIERPAELCNQVNHQAEDVG